MDFEKYKSELDYNTSALTRLIENASGYERNINQDNSWTILQIIEHILILDSIVYKILRKSEGHFAQTEELFNLEKQRKYAATPPLKRVLAPEFALPTGACGTKEEILGKIKTNRKSICDAIETGEIIVDNRTRNHPFFGDITMADWLHVIVSHTERHMIQISEILMQ